MDRIKVGHLRVIFAIQALCVTIYLLSSISNTLGVQPAWLDGGLKLAVRNGVAIGMVLGTVLGWSALRHSMLRARETERKLRQVSSAFMDVMTERFRQWGLTPAESDVALFSLKGLTVNEIADLRGTSSGTIKAQTNAIYRKAGVNGRPQLLSLFIDDLIQDVRLVPKDQNEGAPPQDRRRPDHPARPA